MCGLIGYFSRQPGKDIESLLQRGLQCLQHRGPDDRGLEHFSMPRGTLALGHTRLSIIDLSPGGHQPMASPNGRFTIVFNGEIYNYRELRLDLAKSGHVFRTESDTEVLLAAWAEWGAEALGKLVGMFAFAIYDRQTQTITLARDAFGIKPLYYHCSDSGFMFASEVPALIQLMPDQP